MICPHCEKGIFANPGDDNFKTLQINAGQNGFKVLVEYTSCPACHGYILYLVQYDTFVNLTQRKLIYPPINPYPKCPVEVPTEIAQEYTEACLILPISPTASAAMSRRCLQHFLREVVKVKKGDLIKEIQEVVDMGQLPSYIAEQLDAVRNIGNFGAHPQKNQHTGEILPVEAGEAEWNLEVLEALFDFYCVQPAKAQKRKADLNLKLKEAGKNPLP